MAHIAYNPEDRSYFDAALLTIVDVPDYITDADEVEEYLKNNWEKSEPNELQDYLDLFNTDNQTGLKPIETALKDGTWVILYGEYLGEPKASAAFWGKEGNWYQSEASSVSITVFGWEPTHWMRLFPPSKN